MRYHYIPIRKAKLKKKKIVATPNADEDVEKPDHSYVRSRNVKWYNHSLAWWVNVISFIPMLVFKSQPLTVRVYIGIQSPSDSEK